MVDILSVLLWGSLGLLVIVVGMYWWFIKSYPYKVRIREVTSGDVRLIYDGVAKIKKDSDKVEFLSLYKKINSIKEIPLPPPQAVDYDPQKKKKVIEAWYSDDEGITYIYDKGKVEGFQPFTTKQRQMMVNQLHKKESRKKTKWQDQIPLIVGVTALVVIVAVVLLFWGDAIRPINEAAALGKAALDRADQLWERIIAYEQGKQIVRVEVPTGASPP